MTCFIRISCSGFIAEHTSLRLYLGLGMIGTGIFTILFGMAYFWNIHSLVYFFAMQVLYHFVFILFAYYRVTATHLENCVEHFCSFTHFHPGSSADKTQKEFPQTSGIGF